MEASGFQQALASLLHEGYREVGIAGNRYRIEDYLESREDTGMQVVLMRLRDRVELLSAQNLRDRVAVVRH